MVATINPANNRTYNFYNFFFGEMQLKPVATHFLPIVFFSFLSSLRNFRVIKTYELVHWLVLFSPYLCFIYNFIFSRFQAIPFVAVVFYQEIRIEIRFLVQF